MFGRIGIHLSNDKFCEKRIDAGILLAKEHGSQLVGIYPTDGLTGYSFNDSIIPSDIRKTLRSRNQHFADEITKLFVDKTAAADIKSETRTPRGLTEEVLALQARYCDLLLMSKADNREGSGGLIPNLPESVVMAAGRPVLMIPNVGEIESIGDRILYCWDQRREAARAFNDASPFLSKCQELSILEIDRDDEALEKAAIKPEDFVNYCLSLNYVQPTSLIKYSENIGVGNTILNAASDIASDLIVMGAYGHSRMRQWIMGGASRTLLSTMTVPVLLSH